MSCSEAWEDLYHFVTPLRACNLPASRLKPLVLLLEKKCVFFLFFFKLIVGSRIHLRIFVSLTLSSTVGKILYAHIKVKVNSCVLTYALVTIPVHTGVFVSSVTL